MKNLYKHLLILFLFCCLIFTAACGHTHSYNTVTINPTNNANGYTRHSCSCGEYYDTDITCLLTFESTCTNSNIASTALPNVSQRIVAQNSIFEGVESTNTFKVSSYVGISVGEQITNSTTITIVWQERTQAEKDCLNITNRIQKLYELSYDYNNENALLRTAQYLRTAKYTGTAWNIMGGALDSNFVYYVTQNQGSYNLSGLREIETLTSPMTNEGVDFIHMFGVINAIENTDSITSGASAIAGWAGDLCTLVQEIVNAGVSGDAITTLANQKFNSLNSTFGCYDLIADMDAINIMQTYYNSQNASFAKVMQDYYFNTTTTIRKNMFLNTVFGKTYTDATTMVNDIMTLLQNNFFASTFCGTLNISLTTHNQQFIACATAFANYFVQTN